MLVGEPLADRHPGRLAPLLGAALTAIGRAATSLTPLALLAGAGHCRTRPAALELLAGPAGAEWSRLRPRLDPLRWGALCMPTTSPTGRESGSARSVLAVGKRWFRS